MSVDARWRWTYRDLDGTRLLLRNDVVVARVFSVEDGYQIWTQDGQSAFRKKPGEAKKTAERLVGR